MWNLHFLSDKLDKLIFHKNLDIFFSMFPYIHVGNTLLLDNTPYKSMFNCSYHAIFLELFNSFHGDNQYLLGFILPYLENLHLSRYGVLIFLEDNPFGRIKCINPNNPRLFKMLFMKCSPTCQPIFCNSVKLKLKWKVPY